MDAAEAMPAQQSFQDRAQGTNVGGITAAFYAQHEGRSRLGSAAVTSGAHDRNFPAAKKKFPPGLFIFRILIDGAVCPL
jgi:hypothetical protein